MLSEPFPRPSLCQGLLCDSLSIVITLFHADPGNMRLNPGFRVLSFGSHLLPPMGILCVRRGRKEPEGETCEPSQAVWVSAGRSRSVCARGERADSAVPGTRPALASLPNCDPQAEADKAGEEDDNSDGDGDRRSHMSSITSVLHYCAPEEVILVERPRYCTGPPFCQELSVNWEPSSSVRSSAPQQRPPGSDRRPRARCRCWCALKVPRDI